ncbi:methylphosphotriester-DNA--protein-cysteine methyltransferase family protein [Paenibacillus mesophilus]|uniref:bifunctional transcriptional activator/DNA repair enzyme AdaA n=1 Tax=Paenibacillus mesophilus TaxID=2582849 RepID=UPI00110DD270|nr:bifunctional transcriptional activator/DNA repair enzyme AdaA [Paenibacillus mesophilus]TMV44216.1 methylphosphotriester-DNA--protein-cysteine methyltransferase family protein [Paenibacillus mesophilus]
MNGSIDLTDTGKERLTEEKWQAIIGNDASYDDRFFYAVKSTGIFCRPSCKSKAPNKENVRIFANAEQALAEHFRPCKRCKPNGLRLPDDDWVTQITSYIDSNYSETLTLETLADMCHGSPYHLHRTFKRVKGITPVEYIQRTRMAKAKELLSRSDQAVADIGLNVGMPNTSYFITLFKKMTGHTPAEFRRMNQNKTATEVLQHGSKNKR